MQVYTGGVPQISSSAWPGRECLVIFLAGCDFRCAYCYASHTLEFKEKLLEEIRDVKKQISDAKEEINSVLFAGAEPLLQRGPLVELISYAKQLGLDTGILTNGSRPNILKEMLVLGVNFVGLDIKSPFDTKCFEKTTRSNTFFRHASEIMDDVRKTIELLRQYQFSVDLEFRTTIVPSLMFKKEDVLRIADEIKDMHSIFVLQQFKKESVIDQRYRNLESPSMEFLETLKESVVKKYPNMRVEIRFDDNPNITKQIEVTSQ